MSSLSELNDIGLTSIQDNSTFAYEPAIDVVKTSAFANSKLYSISIPNATSIEANSFVGCEDLYYLDLPGIDYSSNNIFGSNDDKSNLLNLRHIKIEPKTDDGDINIGQTFSGLQNLQKLELPLNVKSIPTGAFSNTSLDKLRFGSTVSLCANSLSGMQSLNELEFDLAKSASNVGLSTCNNLRITSVDASSSIEQLSMFSRCESLSAIIFANHGENIGSLADESFLNCGIVEIDLGKSSIAEIPKDAFSRCNNLTAVYFPNDVTALLSNSFNGCNALNNAVGFDMEHIKYVERIGNFSILYAYNANGTYSYIGPSAFMNLAIGKGASSELTNAMSLTADVINEYAFLRSSLSAINLSSSSSSIPSGCFYQNYYLEHAAVNGGNITSIGPSAFYDCNQLTSISLPASVKSISEDAFNRCYSLQSFSFNSNLTSVQSRAFQDVQQLAEVYFKSTNPVNINENAFLNCYSLTSLHFAAVPGSQTSSEFAGWTSVSRIQVDASISAFGDEYVPSDWFNKDIVNNAYRNFMKFFFNGNSVSSTNGVTFKFNDATLVYDGVKTDFECLEYTSDAKEELSNVSIGSDFNKFTEAGIIPDTTHIIQKNAFSNVKANSTANSQLKKLSANSVEVIQNGALSGLTSLSAFFANTLNVVSDAMLRGCTSLKTVVVQDASSIQASALYNCTSLTSVSTTSKLSSIGDYSFAGCTSLTSLPSNTSQLQSIGQHAYQGCTNLQSIAIPEQVTSIGDYAFSNCTHLTAFSTPVGISSIQPMMLNGCSSLAKIDFWRTSGEPSLLTPANSLSACRNALSAYFRNQTISSVLETRGFSSTTLTASLTAFGNAKPGSLFYTSNNNYDHPMAIANTSNIYIVQDISFIVRRDESGSFTLLSVDPNWESTSIAESALNGIHAIAANAFSSTKKVERIYFSTLANASSILANNTFSSSNAGMINQIYINENIPSETDVSAFYSQKLGSNKAIVVRFNNAYFQDGHIYRDDDPFIFSMVSGVKTIIGVDDTKAPSSGVVAAIPDSYKAISADAFQNTRKIVDIGSFSSISAIHDYAFRYNSTISSINIETKENKLSIGSHAFADSAIQKATINLSSVNNKRQIEGYGLNDNVFLHELIYGKNVVAIAPSAMVNCRSSLTSIEFPDTLTSIGEAAFAEFTDQFPFIMSMNLNQCAALKDIGPSAFYNSISTLDNSTLSISNSITSIGEAAFSYDKRTWSQYLSGLTQVGAAEVNGMTNLKQIGASAFMYNTLRNVFFPSELTSIGDYAFAHPKYRFPIHIKSKIKHIGRGAFKGNVILNPTNIQKNIACIDVTVDELLDVLDTTINSDYTADNTAEFTDATVVSASGSGSDPWKSFAYILDNKMQFCPQNLSIDIVNRALIAVDKSSLTAYIPPYLSCISSQAFAGCTALTSISADESLSIGPSAFYNCSNLKRIVHDFDNPSSSFHISGAVNEASFYNCSKLTGIYLLSTVPYIGPSAFYNCMNLTSMFEDDTLAQKTWWSLSSIGDAAYSRCTNLTSFDIPQAISSIGYDVFKDCSNLKEINIDLTMDQFKSLVGYSDIREAVLSRFKSINDSNPGSYGTTRINFLDATYMNNGIVKIDNKFIKTKKYSKTIGGTEYSRTALTALEYTLFNAASQQYLNLSAISKIDQFVFNGISKLRSINVLPSNDPSNPYELEEIGDYAFNNCTNLASINGGVIWCNKIGCYAFNNCQSLLRLQASFQALSEGSIGQGAFYNTSLNTLEIIDCPLTSSQTLAQTLESFKNIIGYDDKHNQNPLELPEYCIIYFIDKDGNTIGKYDSMLHDLLYASIDINRNALTFVDKAKESIKPLLLVKPIDGSLPAIAANTFHANIIGRWK